MNATSRLWWHDALIYQVYVRSFADSDGDGIGDLEGITSKLDHLASLGANAIWLNPCYPSPQRDHGYDVANYFDIHHEYGTLEDFDRLVAEAQARDIRVLMDLVPSHCSDEHRWFVEALAAPPHSLERARFYFRDGTGPNGEQPPNNWQAAFGGSAWTRINEDPEDGQWYLGTFTPYQPDLDHTNHDVKQLFADILAFWFDRGVDGFRVDAVAGTGKHPDLPDQPPVGPDAGVLDITWLNPYSVFREEGHDAWRHFRDVLNRYHHDHPDRELMLVAEAYAVRRPELIKKFTEPDQFDQMFSFDLMLSPWHKGSIERALHDPLEILASTGTPPAWTLNNHDIQRIVTRLGRVDAHEPDSWTNNNLSLSSAATDLVLGERRARAMAALIYALPGNLFLYQGEELGLPEVFDLPDERREDPVFHRTNGQELGRDGCRIPVPWTPDPATSFGFSTPAVDGTVAPPWLPQPDDWGARSLSALDAQGAETLTLYRRLGSARTQHATRQPMACAVLEAGDDLVAVQRGSLVVVLNPQSHDVRLPFDQLGVRADQLVLNSEDPSADRNDPAEATIAPDSTLWFDQSS